MIWKLSNFFQYTLEVGTTVQQGNNYPTEVKTRKYRSRNCLEVKRKMLESKKLKRANLQKRLMKLKDSTISAVMAKFPQSTPHCVEDIHKRLISDIAGRIIKLNIFGQQMVSTKNLQVTSWRFQILIIRFITFMIIINDSKR